MGENELTCHGNQISIYTYVQEFNDAKRKLGGKGRGKTFFTFEISLQLLHTQVCIYKYKYKYTY